MGGSIANCKKCNKVFRKQRNPMCADCIKREDEQFTLLYRRLQKSAAQGGIAIDVLAAEVGMEPEEIEKLYLEGRLSTAGTLLQLNCPICGVLYDDHNRKGRFCLQCSATTAQQAGVEVKTRQELQLEEVEEKNQQPQIEVQLKKRTPASAGFVNNRFGSMFRD